MAEVIWTGAWEWLTNKHLDSESGGHIPLNTPWDNWRSTKIYFTFFPCIFWFISHLLLAQVWFGSGGQTQSIMKSLGLFPLVQVGFGMAPWEPTHCSAAPTHVRRRSRLMGYSQRRKCLQVPACRRRQPWFPAEVCYSSKASLLSNTYAKSEGANSNVLKQTRVYLAFITHSVVICGFFCLHFPLVNIDLLFF